MADVTRRMMYNMWGRSPVAVRRRPAVRFQLTVNTPADQLTGAYYVRASEQIASTANALARKRRWLGVGPERQCGRKCDNPLYESGSLRL